MVNRESSSPKLEDTGNLCGIAITSKLSTLAERKTSRRRMNLTLMNDELPHARLQDKSTIPLSSEGAPGQSIQFGTISLENRELHPQQLHSNLMQMYLDRGELVEPAQEATDVLVCAP